MGTKETEKQRIGFEAEVRKLLGSSTFCKLRAFAERLAESEADIYVFIARKAVCVMDLFDRLGWPRPRGTFLSDRVIQFFSQEELKGRKVIIVDDIVIAGSTISRIKEFLEGMGAIVQILVFAINNKWHVPRLYQPTGDEHFLSDHESAIFCSALVDTIMLMSRPYAVDFPLLHFETLGRSFELESWSIPGCVAVDASHSSNLLRGQCRLVVHVDKPRAKTLLHAIGTPDLAEWITLSKLRIYGGNYSSQMIMMPIITFNHISKSTREASVRKIIEKHAPIDCADKLLQRLFAAPVLADRFLTYVASFVLGASIVRFFDSCQVRPFNSDVSKLVEQLLQHELQISMGPIVDFGLRIILTNLSTHAIWPESPYSESDTFHFPKELSPFGKELANITGFLEKFPLSDGYLLSDVGKYIVELHRKVELPGRTALMVNPCDTEAMQRLSKGLTYSDLMYLLHSEGWVLEENEVRQKLSEHLDFLVDRGVMVPTTSVDSDGTTYRMYRSGEDLHFIDKHYVMVCEALGNAFDLCSEIKKPSGEDVTFDRITTEKLLVCLLKYMHSLNIATPFTDQGVADKIAIDFNRYGAVANKYYIPAGETKFLYDFLCNAGYIKNEYINKEKLREDFQDGLPIDKLEQGELNVFARNWVYGVLASERATERSIVLSSCSNAADIVRAIYVDLDFCFKDLAGIEIPPSYLGQYRSDLQAIRSWANKFGGTTKSTSDNLWLKNSARENMLFNQYLSESKINLKNFGESTGLILCNAAWDKIISPFFEHHNFKSVFEAEKRIGIPLYNFITTLNAAISFVLGADWDDTAFKGLLSQDSVLRSIDLLEDSELSSVYIEFIEAIRSIQTIPRGNKRLRASDPIMPSGYRFCVRLQHQWHNKRAYFWSCVDNIWRDTYFSPREPFAAKCLLWYDVKNSRSKKTDEVSSHDKRVENFKHGINSWLMEQLNHHEASFCIYLGDAESDNDEKHVFLSDISLINQFFHGLLAVAHANPSVWLRILVSGCDEIDTNLSVQRIGKLSQGRANGKFFNWLAEIKEGLEKKEKDQEIAIEPHSVYYLNLPWSRSGSPTHLPKVTFEPISIEGKIGDDSRNWSFRRYVIHEGLNIAFVRPEPVR